MEKITIIKNFSTPYLTINWSDLIEGIKSEEHKKEIEAIRKAKKEGKEELCNSLKKKLKGFTYSSTYTIKRKKEYISSFENIVGIDLDHLANEEERESLCSKLKKDPHTFACFISPSGEGIKAFFKIEENEKVEEWLKKKEYDQIKKYYAYKFGQTNEYVKEKYNVQGDKAVKDITRLCFISYDPNAYYNPNAKPLTLYNKRLNNIYTQSIIKDPNEKGNRNVSLYNFSLQALAEGYDKEEVIQFCLEKYHDLDYNEVINTISSANRSDIVKNGKQIATKEPSAEITNSEIRELFYKRFDIRYNDVINNFEILDKRQEKPKWTIYDTIISNTIHTYITDLLPKARRINIDKILQVNDIKTYDPFVEKLLSLQWDHQDHIGQLASSITTTNQELWNKDIKKFLVGIVATLMNPNTINHYCLVLTGAEGIGKTTVFKKFVPQEWSEYFTDSPLNLTHKDTNFKLSQNFLISLEELSHYVKKDFNTIKEILTRGSIQEREHYGKGQKKYRRRASFVATLNDAHFLSDEDGERRFWTHKAMKIDYQKSINIDQVYAQALTLYSEGFEYWENQDEIALRRKENRKYATHNMTKELIFKCFKLPSTQDTLARVEKALYYSSSDVLQEITNSFGYNHRDLTVGKVGKELSKLNTQNKIVNGIKRYLLVKKEYCEINREREKDYDEETTN